ncbi:MAG: GntR family transcriptional regulator [Burkholderiales bacterium]|nr:GntR family transcriptional regulator [Burkholderiales bacterium]
MDQHTENHAADSDDAPAAEPRLLAEEVVERLRDLIIQGELAPGVKLNERVLCERLRTSRTPVREAIKFLASEGLVELLPNRGAIVTPITAATVREMFVLLGALEALAGELACVNASDAEIAEIRALHYQMLAHHARGELSPYFRCNQQIHLQLIECAGNATLANTYRALNGHVRRARYMANLSQERWDHAVEEHQKILDALSRREGAVLAALLRSHLSNKMQVVLEALGEQMA